MPSKWSRALSLAVLGLSVVPILALSTRSFESDTFDDALGELEKDAVRLLSSALKDSDGVLEQITMNYETTPPISSRLITSGLQCEVTVGLYCHDCDGTTQPSAFDFASTLYTDWDSSWLGIALDNFDASFELDIDVNHDTNNNFTLSLLKKSVQKEGVVVEVDFQLYLTAATHEQVSFTAGLNLSLRNPLAIMMPLSDTPVQLNQSQGIGFDRSNFDLTPIFNASIFQLEFNAELSLRTVLSLTFDDVNIGALILDLPAFRLDVATLNNALSSCQPPPSGTPSDQIYAELIHMSGGLVANLSYEILGGDESGLIDSWDLDDLLDECYAFFPGLGFIGAVPDSSKSELLTAAPITTCTSGAGPVATGTAAVVKALRGLSPGEKAGVVIGTLTGVTLIAVLAFFAGRGNRAHAVKQAGNRPVWTSTSRPHAGIFKFFGLTQRRGPREFSPDTPSQQPWQKPSATTPSTEYGGGYFPTLNTTEMGQHAGWQVFKQDPYVRVNQTEATTPAATYDGVYDYSIFTPGSEPRETGTPTVTPGGTSRCSGGQAEGLGLLSSPERAAMHRREVSRKPVANMAPGGP